MVCGGVVATKGNSHKWISCSQRRCWLGVGGLVVG